MILTCRAILFDLDGVLVDSTQAVERVWRRWAHEHGFDPELVLEHAHGRRSVETIRIVAPEMDAEEENVKVEGMEIADKEGIVAIPGAPELLRSLPPWSFAVVTSATRALAVARLQYACLGVPQHLITADDVSNGKPSPDPYLRGAALLGIAAADCIVFEDTPAGIESGRAAGMRVIALSTTYPAEQLKDADAILGSLAGVKAEAKSGNAPHWIAKIAIIAGIAIIESQKRNTSPRRHGVAEPQPKPKSQHGDTEARSHTEKN